MPEIDSYSNTDPQDGDEFVFARGTSTYNALWENIKTTVKNYLRALNLNITGQWTFNEEIELEANGSQAEGYVLLDDNGNFIGEFRNNGGNPNLRATSEANFGVGISGTGSAELKMVDNGGRSDNFTIFNLNDDNGNSLEAMRLNSKGSGRMGIAGKTYPSYAVHSAGDVAADGTVRDLSDRRVKEAIEPIKNPLWITKVLEGHTYDRTDKDRHSAGLVAQDVEEVFPVAVDESGDLKTLDQGALLGLAFSAINALQQENEKLRQRLDRIEEQV